MPAIFLITVAIVGAIANVTALWICALVLLGILTVICTWD